MIGDSKSLSFSFQLALALLATALAADEMRNTKRSLSGLGISPWNSVLGGAGSQFGWNPNAFGQGNSDHWYSSKDKLG